MFLFVCSLFVGFGSFFRVFCFCFFPGFSEHLHPPGGVLWRQWRNDTHEECYTILMLHCTILYNTTQNNTMLYIILYTVLYCLPNVWLVNRGYRKEEVEEGGSSHHSTKGSQEEELVLSSQYSSLGCQEEGRVSPQPAQGDGQRGGCRHNTPPEGLKMRRRWGCLKAGKPPKKHQN